MCLVFPSFGDGAFDASSTSDTISYDPKGPSPSLFLLPLQLRPRLLRLAHSILQNEWRYNVGHDQNEVSSIARVMLPLVRIYVAFGLHPQ
jgi:hypothetical protein